MDFLETRFASWCGDWIKPALEMLGITLRAEGQHDEAIAEYRVAIMLDPNDADAHHSLGITLHDVGGHWSPGGPRQDRNYFFF